MTDYTYLYANDTARVMTCSTINEVSDGLNMTVEQANIWFDNHSLNLNVSKTKAMHLGTAQRLNNNVIDPPITCNGSFVENVRSF